MLTPMLVQYLVGLCCLRWDPDTIDVILGDMVLDSAAGKERDVDVTVTIAESPGVIRAFKAYEVKREENALDVADVEQLCQKLRDMPKVTHRAIVSASGFTDGALRKAAFHGVELYSIKPWTRPLQEQFPNLAMEGLPGAVFKSTQMLLIWSSWHLHIVAPEAKGSFTWRAHDRVFDENAKTHSRFATIGDYERELLLRSTEILVPLEPASKILNDNSSIEESGRNVGPSWTHTHTLEVTNDGAYIEVLGKLVRINQVTINGHLQWRKGDDPKYYVIERVPSGDAFAGAIVAMEPREGRMKGLVFSPRTRSIGVHFVQLAEKHYNMIRRLRLESPK